MLKWSCKKIFAGIVIISLTGNIFPVMPTFSAENLPSYYERNASEREKALLSARDFAFEYLKNSSEEPLWKNKYPYISGEKFFYTANDDIPSYVEFKVSTSENADSGFIIVNLDNNDVKVPIASPSEKTPSEALNIRFDKNHGKSENEKLYYFSPFDQWIVDENGNAETLNPNNQEDKIIETEKSENNSEISFRSIENFSKNNKEKILTEEWKNKQNTKFAEMKKDAVEFVNSAEMRGVRVMERSVKYVSPGLSDRTLPNPYKTNECTSAVPCYRYFYEDNCSNVGCAPVSLGIVFWYYDRMWYPDLIPDGDAPRTNNDFWGRIIVNPMISILRKYMRTGKDSNDCGATNSSYMGTWMLYAKNQWYSNAKSIYTPTTNINNIRNAIKNDINEWRPIILFTDNHAITAWWYHTWTNGIRVNLGWWAVNHMWYDASNVDMSLNAITYHSNIHPLHGYWRILMEWK